MNEFQFRDITKTSDENPSAAIFSLYIFKGKKKKKLVEFLDFALNSRVIMIKSAEAEAFLLITILKCVEHNVYMSDYLFAKNNVLFCQT